MGFYWILLLLFMTSVSLIKLNEAQTTSLLINCGVNSSIIADGRNWIGDVVPNNNFTLSSPGIISSSNASSIVDFDPSYKDLYKNARIFNATSAYNFTIAPGSYYLRIHLSSSSFENFDINDSSFELVANKNLKLLSKFNVPSEILWRNMNGNSNSSSLIKEYFINVDAYHLILEFIPDSKSFAFANAIELIPVLDELFVDSINNAGSTNDSKISSDQGIETMYRLNVGGPKLDSNTDPNLSRTYLSDESYMFAVNAATTVESTSRLTYSFPNESSIAPLPLYKSARTMKNTQVVDKKFNISWKFDVDPNFDYLVRFHFCELHYTKPNQRIFKIYINNKTAADNYDVFVRAGGKNKAYREDFLDSVPETVDSLWIQLGQATQNGGSSNDALLNGLEIFKLARNGNLARVLNRFEGSNDDTVKEKSMLAPVVIGVAILLAVMAACAGVVCFCISKRKKKNVITSTTNRTPPTLTGSGKVFTLAEIRSATNNFDESLIIGTGGFGKVYKGEMANGERVAIKRAHPNSQQGVKEFETEIEMLSKLRHRHLVSLMGYCDEHKEMILVYEYMANGTLRSHLYGSGLPGLTLKRRLEACIGAARGLHYLHTGYEQGGIIHRDVKTTNILLNEGFVAKVADFGLSKDGPALDQTHVSTAVKGSFGYLDPEYFRRQQLTISSDVYSFGVVLLEAVCVRPVIDPTLPREEVSLVEWGMVWWRKGLLERIVDRRMDGQYELDWLRSFGEVVEKCLADEGKDRPSMGEVLWHLERLLVQLQSLQRVEEEDKELLTCNETD